MFNDVLLEIAGLRYVIITYIALILLTCVIFWIATRSFDWSKGNVRCFGLLYGMPGAARTVLALSLGRFFLVVVSAVLCERTGIHQLAMLLVLTLVINVILVDYKGLFLEVFSYLGTFAILFLQRLLYLYYQQVEHSWAMMAMAVLMGLFAVLYATYGMVRMVDKIMKRDMMKNER